MLDIFGVIKDQLKPKINGLCIDNWIFKLHYRVTCISFCIATILVTSRQYLGEHIRCISDMKDPDFERVIETFCFFTATFTIVDNHNYDTFRYGQYGHPGVLSYGIGSKQKIRKHMYYQWVPFFLFGQAIMFYLPHLFWKRLEDGRVQKLVVGLNCSRFALLDKEQEIDDQTIPSKEDRNASIRKIKDAFMKRVSLNQSWARTFILCEVLNVLHVILQFHWTDKFLGKQFYSLGPKLVSNGSQVLDEVFPKVTKCTFHKYGPSGSIQVHDALCVLALNIINEKIYVFLWFWLIILFFASCVILVWRLITLVLYKKSTAFNQFIFGGTLRGKMHPWHVKMVIEHCTYSDWLFLKYISKNMDGLAFRQFFIEISDEVEEKKPLCTYPEIERPIGFSEVEKFD